MHHVSLCFFYFFILYLSSSSSRRMIVCLLAFPLAPTHTRILTARTIVLSFLLTRAHLHRAMVLFFIFLLAANVDRSSYSRKTEDNGRCAVATRLCAYETPIARHFTIIVSVGFIFIPRPLSLFVSRVRKLSSCESEHRVELERYVPCGIVLI